MLAYLILGQEVTQASHRVICKTLDLQPTQASRAFPGANLTAGAVQTRSAHQRRRHVGPKRGWVSRPRCLGYQVHQKVAGVGMMFGAVWGSPWSILQVHRYMPAIQARHVPTTCTSQEHSRGTRQFSQTRVRKSEPGARPWQHLVWGNTGALYRGSARMLERGAGEERDKNARDLRLIGGDNPADAVG